MGHRRAGAGGASDEGIRSLHTRRLRRGRRGAANRRSTQTRRTPPRRSCSAGPGRARAIRGRRSARGVPPRPPTRRLSRRTSRSLTRTCSLSHPGAGDTGAAGGPGGASRFRGAADKARTDRETPLIRTEETPMVIPLLIALAAAAPQAAPKAGALTLQRAAEGRHARQDQGRANPDSLVRRRHAAVRPDRPEDAHGHLREHEALRAHAGGPEAPVRRRAAQVGDRLPDLEVEQMGAGRSLAGHRHQRGKADAARREYADGRRPGEGRRRRRRDHLRTTSSARRSPARCSAWSPSNSRGKSSARSSTRSSFLATPSAGRRSPSARRIAYARPDGRLSVMDRDGGKKEVPDTKNALLPAWSDAATGSRSSRRTGRSSTST